MGWDGSGNGNNPAEQARVVTSHMRYNTNAGFGGFKACDSNSYTFLLRSRTNPSAPLLPPPLLALNGAGSTVGGLGNRHSHVVRLVAGVHRQDIDMYRTAESEHIALRFLASQNPRPCKGIRSCRRKKDSRILSLCPWSLMMSRLCVPESACTPRVSEVSSRRV